jgi:glycosyltransferase involved in cell wall biosynthesis
VSVIVPARNEQASLGACLESLVSQVGIGFEVIVVDDGSTDATRAIAQSFPVVTVLEPGPLPTGWSGKNNALTAGAIKARGEWLLFTDADTVHRPGSLARAVTEANANHADLLSYSPEQEVHGFWESAIMPVIFAELATTYPPSEVSDPGSSTAAANGQYLLMTRQAYDAVGGHAAVAGDLLEDVALARLVKQSGRKMVFRYGSDAVRTRMYRNFGQLREGWTKNLAILFPSPAWLALWRFLEFAVLIASLAVFIVSISAGHSRYAVLGLLAPVVTLKRITRAHFAWSANVLAALGLPLFSYLLLRSKLSYTTGTVNWKGRAYSARDCAAGTVSQRSAAAGRS